jgi:hypothetical protein
MPAPKRYPDELRERANQILKSAAILVLDDDGRIKADYMFPGA